MEQKKKKIILIAVVALATVIMLGTAFALSSKPKTVKEASNSPATPDSAPASYMIEDVEVIEQTTLKAGCETYACTMLLKILGFDVNEFTIADNYLDCHYVYEADDGTKYGPDMHSGFAGTAYEGWGVYAPAMAKSMNRYLSDQKSDLHAYPYENIPLTTLCEDYVAKGIPVMIWATTNMDEPFVFDTWVVNYVDENAKAEMGDTVSWYMHEHCLVLIGYDENEYYFADSAAGTVSHFDRELVEKRYEQLFSQCIVVQKTDDRG